MIAIGIGATSRAVTQDFERALDEFCGEFERCDVVATFEWARFLESAKIAAQQRGTEFRVFSIEALAARNQDCLTRSARSVELFGISSVAEASALAAAGPASRLKAARRIIGNVTIAAAESMFEDVESK